MFCNMKHQKKNIQNMVSFYLAIWLVILLLIDIFTKQLFYNSTSGVLNIGGAWWLSIHWLVSVVIGGFVAVSMFFATYKNQVSFLSTCFLVAGIFWNMYDRMLFHGVRDWIDIYKILGFHFPLFNFADCYITAWICILLYQFLLQRK